METAPPHALETNLEACADAKRKKRDERVLFSDWLIGVVCFFFFFARVSFLRSQARFDLQLAASLRYVPLHVSIHLRRHLALPYMGARSEIEDGMRCARSNFADCIDSVYCILILKRKCIFDSAFDGVVVFWFALFEYLVIVA